MKRRIDTYTFNPTTSILTLTGEGSFAIEGLLAVINVTAEADLYLAGLAGLGYASVAGNAVTLEADTADMSSGDKLLIYYEDATALPVSGPLTAAQLAAAALATHADSAAILAKLSADPATQTTLAAVLAKLTSDPATQTTLAAVLAKQSSDPSTGTKQDTAAAKLDAILAELQAQVDLAATLWTDNSGAFYVRRDVIDVGAGTVTVSFTDPAGATATPGAGLRPAANEESLLTEQARYDVLTTGTGYTAGDVLIRSVVMDQNTSPPSVVTSFWLNLTSGAVISAPNSAHIAEASRNVVVASSALPAGASTETTLAAVSAKLPASLGAKTSAQSLSTTTASDDLLVAVLGGVTETAPASDTASSGLNGRLQRIAQRITSLIALIPAALTASGWFKVAQDGVEDGATRSATVSSAAVGDTFDTTGYGAVTFQVVANASGNTWLVEGTNDQGTTWTSVALRRADQGGASGGTVTSTAGVGNTYLPTVVMPRMRWRVSNQVGGSTTIAVGLKRSNAPNAMDVNVGNASVPVSPLGGATNTPANLARVNSASGAPAATFLKSSSGRVFPGQVTNVAAYDVFLKFYNKASSPTIGTDPVAFTIPIKAGTTVEIGPGSFGAPFSLGIAYAITKLQADNDTTAVAAGDLTGFFCWQ